MAFQASMDGERCPLEKIERKDEDYDLAGVKYVYMLILLVTLATKRIW